jgi:hypothetical protein
MKEITVTFTKAELDYLEFYLRWSSKRLFGNHDPDRDYRRLRKSIVRKARTALAEDKAKMSADIATLERMLGTGEQEAQS